MLIYPKNMIKNELITKNDAIIKKLEIFNYGELIKIIRLVPDIDVVIYIIDNVVSKKEDFSYFDCIENLYLENEERNKLFLHYFWLFIKRTSDKEFKTKSFLRLYKKLLETSRLTNNINKDIFVNINKILKHHLKYDKDINEYNKLLSIFLTGEENTSIKNNELIVTSSEKEITEKVLFISEKKLYNGMSMKSLEEYINEKWKLEKNDIIEIIQILKNKRWLNGFLNSDYDRIVWDLYYSLDYDKKEDIDIILDILNISHYKPNFLKTIIIRWDINKVDIRIKELIEKTYWSNPEEDLWCLTERIKSNLFLEDSIKKYISKTKNLSIFSFVIFWNGFDINIWKHTEFNRTSYSIKSFLQKEWMNAVDFWKTKINKDLSNIASKYIIENNILDKYINTTLIDPIIFLVEELYISYMKSFNKSELDICGRYLKLINLSFEYMFFTYENELFNNTYNEVYTELSKQSNELLEDYIKRIAKSWWSRSPDNRNLTSKYYNDILDLYFLTNKGQVLKSLWIGKDQIKNFIF